MKTRYLSCEEKRIILEQYEKGFNTVQIGNQLGRSSSSIQRFLKKNGYEKLEPRYINWTEEERDSIINRYNNGETTQQIADSFPDKVAGASTIRLFLIRNGVKMRRTGYPSKVSNHEYFKSIDTPEQAYWLGIMISDGCIHEEKNMISLELHKKDKYLIEAFKEAVGADTATTKSRNCYKTSFASKEMIEDLGRFGVVHRKSSVGTFLPKLKEELMPHLIRGIFDGDGTVYKRKPNALSFGFYGSSRLCNEIRDYLCRKIGLNENKVFDKENVSMIYFSRKQDVKAFYDFIYKDSTIHMKRKKEVFDQYFDNTN